MKLQLSAMGLLLCVVTTISAQDIVAVIDSGINKNAINEKYLCKTGHKAFLGYSIRDDNGHGTNIVSIIGPNLKKDQCIVVIKAWASWANGDQTANAYAMATQYAQTIKAKFVNYSGGGAEPIDLERISLYRLLQTGAHIAVASGNNKNKNMKSKCNYYPACYKFRHKNFHIVSTKRPFANDNFGFPIKYDRGCGGKPYLCGTSQATAFYMRKLIGSSR